jgi:putative transposase
MVNYRRNFVPGGTFFFTVTLADRRSSVLVDLVDLLRNALRMARQERPFIIEAIVILPEPSRDLYIAAGRFRFCGTLAAHQGAFQQRADRRFN